MVFKSLCDYPERFLFRYVLTDYVDDYLFQGWEVVGMMQNTIRALNSVTSFIMVFKLE